jgi:hypothetical protein
MAYLLTIHKLLQVHLINISSHWSRKKCVDDDNDDDDGNGDNSTRYSFIHSFLYNNNNNNNIHQYIIC